MIQLPCGPGTRAQRGKFFMIFVGGLRPPTKITFLEAQRFGAGQGPVWWLWVSCEQLRPPAGIRFLEKDAEVRGRARAGVVVVGFLWAAVPVRRNQVFGERCRGSGARQRPVWWVWFSVSSCARPQESHFWRKAQRFEGMAKASVVGVVFLWAAVPARRDQVFGERRRGSRAWQRPVW